MMRCEVFGLLQYLSSSTPLYSTRPIVKIREIEQERGAEGKEGRGVTCTACLTS